MLHAAIPGFGDIALDYLLLDINGTLTRGGVLTSGVDERVARLQRELHVLLVTADTRGTAARLAEVLDVSVERVPVGREAKAKAEVASRLGTEHVVGIGNGANDARMLEAARLGIAVLGDEGLATSALTSADLVVPHINHALDLLLDPVRLVSTLRH